MSQSEQRKRTALIGVRALPEERDALRAAARARGISVPKLLLSSAMQAIAGDGPRSPRSTTEGTR
jgi:uncharacterized protein (DUF1778 family)